MIDRVFARCIWLALALALGGCDDDQPTGDAGDAVADAEPDAGDAAIPGMVRIVTPAAGTRLTGADDLDGDANSGLRVEVALQATGADDGQVRITADGVEYRAAVANGQAAAVVSLPSAESQRVRIRAEIIADGVSVIDEVEVIVAVRRVNLTVAPLPGGGCDFGAADDRDPETPGIQSGLLINGDGLDTAAVRVIGGAETRLPVEGDAVEVPVTFIDGATTIEVRGAAADARDGTLGPLVYTARGAPPVLTLDLRLGAESVRGLADGVIEGDRIFWTVQGQSVGLAPGAMVELSWDPPLPGAPERAPVDPEGDLRFEVGLATGASWTGTIEARAVDPCGTPSAPARHELRLDAVTPVASIRQPASGQPLTVGQDIDPARPGVQIAFAVDVIDPRPADYRLSLRCGPAGEAPVDRSAGAGDAILRSALPEAMIVGTFGADERGEVVCRVAADTFPNPIVAPPAVYRLDFDGPTFTVESPQSGQCLTDDRIVVAGVGTSLDGNQPALEIEGNASDRSLLAPTPLMALGAERYGVTLGSDALPDGAWRLRVSGSTAGGHPVDIEPGEVSVIVDRTPPTIEFLAPSAPFLADSDPATAGFQTPVRVRVCGADRAALTLESAPPVLGDPITVEIPPGDCADLDLGTFTAPVQPIRLIATVTDPCWPDASAALETRIDPTRLVTRVVSPTDGAGIGVDADGDPAAAGCQINLEGLVSGLGPDAAFTVCTAVDQGRPDPACPGGSNALVGPCAVTGVAEAGTSVRCPLSLSDGVHALTLVAEGDARLGSTPVQVRVDCSPPATRALVVEQDADGNGCIHRLERLNAGEAGDNARVTVSFGVEGLADGRTVRLRTEGGLDLGVAAAQGGAGQISASLPPGNHRLYLRGQDAVGNALPEPGEAGALTRSIEVDTRPPTPALIGLEPGVCLSAAEDADPRQPGLQLGLRVQTGRAAGEAVRATLRVDGDPADDREGALDLADFGATLGEGPRALTVTVADACGNVGSVGGFETVDGLPDWRLPRPVVVRVDTVAPGLGILGVEPSAVLAAADDADGDPQNGFQLDVAIEVDPAAPVESGLRIDVDVNDNPAVTAPSPLVVPDDFDGLLPTRLTLSGGPQALVARATDACGNAGASAPLPLTVDIAGCASRIIGFASNPEIRASAEPLAVAGLVDLVDLDCVGAPVTLVVDGAAGPDAVVGGDGAVRFDGVDLEPGAHTVSLRVGPVRAVTLDSPAWQVIIDPLAPTVAITRPAGPDPAVLLTDDRPEIAGQQATIIAEIREARVDTDRRARLTIGGVELGEQAVEGSDPATAQFRDVTLPAGRQTIQICVTDGAGNTGCARREIDADPAAPGGVGPVQVEIVDRRSTEVALRFTAPGDDGAVGPVSGYALRRSDAPFVDEADWIAAAPTEIRVPAAVGAGAAEALVLRGPGPTLADGLALEKLHAVAVRAFDDAGRLGPLASVEVDLRLRTASGALPARGGAWEAGDVINTTSPVIGIGDIDADGFDDLVIAASQSAGATGAAFVFGARQGDDVEGRSLETAPGMVDAFFGVVAAAAGDLNGDGAPDVAVQGYLDGFAGAAVALYFGCPAAPCDRVELVRPDALVITVGGRFTNSLAGVGDVWRPTGAGFDDLFVGGALAGEADAFVVAGRDDWPALPDAIRIGPGGDGPRIARLITPEGPAGVYAAGLGDLDGDGFDDLALSAGDDINRSYVFYGGPWPGAVAFDADDPDTVRLTDPCPVNGPSFGTAFVGGADLDGDIGGRPDFVVGNRANKRLVVFDADRVSLDCFGRSPVQYGRFVDLAGDIDGDGAIDLIATHGDPAVPAAHIFYNDGLGRFGVGPMISPRGAHVTLARPATRKLGVAGAGDINGDGRDDVAAVYLDGDAGMTWIVYY